MTFTFKVFSQSSDFKFSIVPVGPAIPTLFIKQSNFLVFFDISLNNFFLLFKGCFFALVKYFFSISHIKTVAPLARQTLAVAQPIPDAPAEITIFLLFRVLSIKSFQVDV